MTDPIAKSEDNKSNRFPKFLMLFIIGFLIIFIGIIILMVALVLSGGSVNFGGIVFIGPIPIVVGVGPEVQWLILFSIILAVLTIIMFLLLRRKLERTSV